MRPRLQVAEAPTEEPTRAVKEEAFDDDDECAPYDSASFPLQLRELSVTVQMGCM